jgi:hypothetical protein
MRDYGKCVAHPIVVGGWGQQKGTDTRALAHCKGVVPGSRASPKSYKETNMNREIPRDSPGTP